MQLTYSRVHSKTKQVSALASAWTTEVADTSLNLLNILAAGTARAQSRLMLLTHAWADHVLKHLAVFRRDVRAPG